MTERVALLEREMELLRQDLLRLRQHSTSNSFPARPAQTIAPTSGSYPSSGTVVPIVFLDADFPDSVPASASWTKRQRGSQRFYATVLDDELPDVDTRVQAFNWRGRWYISQSDGQQLPDVAMVKVLDNDANNAVDVTCCMYPGAIRSRIPGAPRTSGDDQDCDPDNPCANSGWEKITKVWVQPHCPGAVLPDCVLAKRVSDEYDCKGTAQPVYKQMACDECCPVWLNAASGDPVGTRINAHIKFGNCGEQFFHLCFHECVVRYTPEGFDANGSSAIVNVTGPITSLSPPNDPIGAWVGEFSCTFQSPRRVVEFTIDPDPALGGGAPDTVFVEVTNGCTASPTAGPLWWINPASDDFETYTGATNNSSPTGRCLVLTQGAAREIQWEECTAEWYMIYRCLDDTPSGIRFVDVSLFQKHPDPTRTTITDQDIVDALGAEIECAAADYFRVRYVGDTTILDVTPVLCANTVSGSLPGLSFPFGDAYATTVDLLGHTVAWNPYEFHSPCSCQGTFIDENLTFPFTCAEVGGTTGAPAVRRLAWQNVPVKINLSW